MSRIALPPAANDLDYPTSDGKPMAETDLHRILMLALIGTLTDFFRTTPRVYVSGNLLVFYKRGDLLKHVSPDVFVVRGVAKRLRDNYLIWRERKAPEFVIELTSHSTKREDTRKKLILYRECLEGEGVFPVRSLWRVSQATTSRLPFARRSVPEHQLAEWMPPQSAAWLTPGGGRQRPAPLEPRYGTLAADSRRGAAPGRGGTATGGSPCAGRSLGPPASRGRGVASAPRTGPVAPAPLLTESVIRIAAPRLGLAAKPSRRGRSRR